MRRTLIVVLAVTLAGVLAASALASVRVTTGHGTESVRGQLRPSWTCLMDLCVGQSRELVDYRHGKDWERMLYRRIGVQGGSVGVYFYKEYVLDYVALENVKPTDRVTGVSTCDPIFRLPDGVALGTRIPFGRYWKGYTRVSLFEPGPRPGWRRFVRVGGTKFRVILDIERGRVTCVSVGRVFK